LVVIERRLLFELLFEKVVGLLVLLASNSASPTSKHASRVDLRSVTMTE